MWAAEGSRAQDSSKSSVHDHCVDEAVHRMIEPLGDDTYDIEPKAAPKPYRPLIGTDDEIELHGQEAAFGCPCKRVFAHGRRNASSTHASGRCVAAIGDVRAASALVWVHIVSPHHALADGCHEYLVLRGEPVRKRLAAVPVPRQRVCLAGHQYRLENAPHSVGIADLGMSNDQGGQGKKAAVRIAAKNVTTRKATAYPNPFEATGECFGKDCIKPRIIAYTSMIAATRQQIAVGASSPVPCPARLQTRSSAPLGLRAQDLPELVLAGSLP